MIQDIAPKKYVNHYEEQSPAAEDWMLVYRDGKVLCRFDNEKMYFPKVKEITQEEQDVTYLFTISDERFFLLKNGIGRLWLGETGDFQKCQTSISWICGNYGHAAF